MIKQVINDLHDCIISGEAFSMSYVTGKVEGVLGVASGVFNIDVRGPLLEIYDDEVEFCVPSNPR